MPLYTDAYMRHWVSMDFGYAVSRQQAIAWTKDDTFSHWHIVHYLTLIVQSNQAIKSYVYKMR